MSAEFAVRPPKVKKVSNSQPPSSTSQGSGVTHVVIPPKWTPREDKDKYVSSSVLFLSRLTWMYYYFLSLTSCAYVFLHLICRPDLFSITSYNVLAQCLIRVRSPMPRLQYCSNFQDVSKYA